MMQVAFFPWIEIENQIEVQGFVLTPYCKIQDQLPYLKPYLEQYRVGYMCNKKRSDHVAILNFKDREFHGNYTDVEMESLFEFASCLMFSLLSSRYDCLDARSNYFNSISCRLVVQSIKDNHASNISNDYRNRFGHSRHGNEAKNVIFISQWIVDLSTYLFDKIAPFLDTILKRYNEYQDLILVYNSANTDSEDIAINSECILLWKCIELLFPESDTRKNSITNAFYDDYMEEDWLFIRDLKHFKRSSEDSWRLYKDDNNLWKFKQHKNTGDNEAIKITSLIELWIIDFCNLRNNTSHYIKKSYKTIWSHQEHLILSSIIIPLLIKIKLSKDDQYKLSDEDIKHVKMISFLLCEESVDHQGWNNACNQFSSYLLKKNLADHLDKVS